MTEKMVTIKVTSLEGHSEFTLTPVEAIEKIKALYNDEKKWVYIDGNVIHPTRVTQEMLLNARSILASGAVVGGANFSSGEEYNIPNSDNSYGLFDDELELGDAPEMMADNLEVELNLKIEDMQDAHGNANITGSGNGKFVVAIEVDSTSKNIPVVNIWVDKKEIVTVAHLRKFLFSGGETKLTEFLLKELDRFRQIYNID